MKVKQVQRALGREELSVRVCGTFGRTVFVLLGKYGEDGVHPQLLYGDFHNTHNLNDHEDK